MAEDIRIVSGDAFALLLSGTVDAAQVFADLRPGVLSEAAGTNVVWVQGGQFTDGIGVVAPATIYSVAPVTGHLTHVAAVGNAQPNANITIPTSIGGVAVTGGTVVMLSTSPAGTVATAAPTAGNAVVEGVTSVAVTPSTSNSGNIVFTVLLGYTRTSS